MSERSLAGAVLALVAGVLIGLEGGPGPGVEAAAVAVTLAVLGVGLHRLDVGRVLMPGLVAVALVGIGAALAQRALHGLHAWPLTGAVEARADAQVTGTLTSDPTGGRYRTRVLVRVEHARLTAEAASANRAVDRTVLVVADGEAAPRLSLLTSGDRVTLVGWLRPLEGFDERHRWSHAAARFDAHRLVAFEPARGVLPGIANSLRATVERGLARLAPTEQGVVRGFVLGDTRAIPPVAIEQFRAAGLSHLLAVSGANVAFVLAMFGPALSRCSRHVRLLAGLAIVLVFAAMTRYEPSVLRAAVMAGVSMLALHLGRPATARRALLLAVGILVVVDPFLVRSVGFQLSVAACAGIVTLQRPIAARLRGPEWLREGLATTLAAQIGVTPVLIPVFGSVPLVALPANLAAVPLAAPLTTWSLAAGSLAGLAAPVMPGLRDVVAIPSRLLAGAVLGIADLAARAPLPVGGREVAWGTAAVLLVGVIRLRRRLRRDALGVPPG